MNAAQILKAMEAQREFMVPLDGERKVTLRRPTDLQIQTNFIKLAPGAKPEDPPKPSLYVDPAHLHRYGVGWSGFAEADLLGAAGGSDPAPFDPLLLQAWLECNPAQINVLVEGLLGNIVQHINSKAEAEKN